MNEPNPSSTDGDNDGSKRSDRNDTPRASVAPGDAADSAVVEEQVETLDPQGPADRLSAPEGRTEAPRLTFAIVGIGASAGGLEAYSEFLQHMPSDSGMAFVLVQHLSPSRESMVAELLSRHTDMTVLQVEDGMMVKPNHVYVIRPGHTMTIKHGRLHLGESLLNPGHRRPVDDFFRSLAEEQQQRAIAVIMSGMGSNGSAGAEAIKAVGGVCIAQDPDSAKFPSMPRSLIDNGMADFILQPKEMPEILLRYAAHPYACSDGPIELVARQNQKTLSEIVAIMRTRLRHDFTGYKKPTVVRRIQRRMGLLQVTEMADYARLLRQNPAEVTQLADDLMIHVTGFFRDPEAWETLRERCLVPLVAGRDDHTSIRGWVTACSSGEEAYTLAMLLLESTEQAGKQLDIKIFATDTADRSLIMARAGIYPGGIEAEIAPHRLARYFDKEEGHYRMKKEVRELVVFAPQNVLQDPPFSRLDICTCRNLLIYLEPEIQQRVMRLLHFGLREGGVLMLGTSETTGPTEDLFEPIDKKWRIFRRIGQSRQSIMEFPPARLLTHLASERDQRVENRLPRVSVAHLAKQILLEHYTPAAVVIDRQGQIVYFHGETHRFLDQPRGEPTRDLLLLARETVRPAIRQALQQLPTDHTPLRIRDGTIETDTGRHRVVIGIRSLEPQGYPGFYLVDFYDYPDPLPQAPVGVADVTSLNEELQRARDELQSTIEELQTSNEEMKASHEEITSINEELQSSNEELETSKEELQSLNEELTTVNAQLEAKMEEMERLSNDLASLLASTDIAVVFLDRQFRIRRYTPAIKPLMDLIPSDLGRPLDDMARKFTDPSLTDDVRTVLDRLVPIEREVAGNDDRFYLRRVLPYRTIDNRIDGVVVTFVDETERQSALLAQKRAETELHKKIELEREARALAEAASSAKDEFLANVSHELRTPLSAILLWARLLQQETTIPDRLKEGIVAIIKSAEAQKELVEDLLDTTQVAGGHVRLDLKPTALRELLASAVYAIQPTAASKQVTIETELGLDIGLVRIDSDRIRQVVWNLLSNAVKFTPAGGQIFVGLWRQDHQVELQVRDNGKGIPKDQIVHIFERFRQIEPQESGFRSGLGLGLTICRQLVELHGGTIEASSDGLGHGTTLKVLLPLVSLTDQPVPEAPVPAIRLAGVTVLLVEDDPATRHALTAALTAMDIDVQPAEDGQEAFDLYARRRPDLVISDLNLPVLDGYTLMQQIRQFEVAERLPRAGAIAFSALSRPRDRERAKESGYDVYLAKPVAADELLLTLQTLSTRH